MSYSVYPGISYSVLTPGEDGAVIARDIFEIKPGDEVFLGSGDTVGVVRGVHEAQVPVWRLSLETTRAVNRTLGRKPKDPGRRTAADADPGSNEDADLFLASTQVIAYETMTPRSDGGYIVQTVGDLVKELGLCRQFLLPANTLNDKSPLRIKKDDKMVRVRELMPRGIRPVRALEVRGPEGQPGMILLANGAIIPALGLRDPENIETIAGTAVDTPSGRALIGSVSAAALAEAEARAEETAQLEAAAQESGGGEIETDTPGTAGTALTDLTATDLEKDAETPGRKDVRGKLLVEPKPKTETKPKATPEQIAERIAFVRKHVVEAEEPITKTAAAKQLGVSPATISQYLAKIDIEMKREKGAKTPIRRKRKAATKPSARRTTAKKTAA